MSLIILFGLPGAGKTFVGNILQTKFGYHFYDGDKDLPHEMRLRIQKSLPITDTLRDEFFDNIIASIKRLKSQYQNLVISQTFIKEKYRRFVFDTISDVQFILVQTDTVIREKRLVERVDAPLDLEYTRTMVVNFEDPRIPHNILSNNELGEKSVLQQLHKVLD